MNLVADEGVERQIVERLRQAGHKVLYIAELEPGINDDVILTQANVSHALLVTLDKDFGELVCRQGLVHSGVILLRLAGLQPETKAMLVTQVRLRETTVGRVHFPSGADNLAPDRPFSSCQSRPALRL